MRGEQRSERHRPTLGALLALVGAAATATAFQTGSPSADGRGDEAYELHGERVPDPFRWLEASGEARDEWAHAQDERTVAAFEDDPLVESLRNRIIELNGYSRAPVPRVAGGLRFTGRTPAGVVFREIHVQDLSAEKGAALLVGPDAHPASPDTPVAIGEPVPSPDGAFVLYGASSSSLPSCVRVVEASTGEDLPDDAVPIYYWPWRVTWLADSSGFVYVDGSSVRIHRLGTPVGEDPVVFRSQDSPAPALAVRAAADGSMLFVTAFHPTEDTTKVFARDVASDGDWTPLITEPAGSYQVLGKHEAFVFVYTTYGAPNGRVIAVDLDRPGVDHWSEIVPEAAEAIYDDNHPIRPTVGIFGDRIAALYGTEGRLVLRVHDFAGKLTHEIEHAELGFTESGLVGHPGEPKVRYDVQSMFDPGSAHEVDLHTGKRAVIGRAEVPFDPGEFEIYRRSYESLDGTTVPIFVAHRKGLERDGSHAAIVNNWSSMGMVVRPLYLPELHAWVELGGVLAVPAVRGSGEYGEAWERAGVGRNKVAALDDFGAAAKWLVAEGYASEGGVGLLGASMSGPATAGALVRHADAFGASVIQIPRVDLLAAHAFAEEYGDFNDEADFRAMMEWLPLRNATEKPYPPVLVQVGSLDTVAPPFHGYKLAATLQAAQTADVPIYLQVIWGVGHNQGIGIPHRSETLALQFAFFARSLGLGTR